MYPTNPNYVVFPLILPRPWIEFLGLESNACAPSRTSRRPSTGHRPETGGVDPDSRRAFVRCGRSPTACPRAWAAGECGCPPSREASGCSPPRSARTVLPRPCAPPRPARPDRGCCTESRSMRDTGSAARSASRRVPREWEQGIRPRSSVLWIMTTGMPKRAHRWARPLRPDRAQGLIERHVDGDGRWAAVAAPWRPLAQ